MPELPEVESARRLAERALTGRRVVEAIAADDEIVFAEDEPAVVASRLADRTVTGAERHGKQLWLTFDEGAALLIHFGMTGRFHIRGERPIKLRATGAVERDDWPPRFMKLRLLLDDGGDFVFTNPRRLGRIRFRDDPRAEPPVSLLGFDPLTELPTPTSFIAAIAKRKAPIKAVLLDQTFAAGVGNWIADEALYQARIDPRRRASELTMDDAKRLRTKLASIVRKAVEVDAVKSKFPRSWLFHHRWGKNAEAVTDAGERIIHETIGGRTTAWVPERQR